MMKIKIYIVDDEWMAIKYFHLLLESVEMDCEIVGESTTATKALNEIVRLKPDVVFTDISMPVMNGLELSEKVLSRVSTKIYLLTSYKDFDYIKQGIKIGVADYILKNELNAESLKNLLQKAEKEILEEKKKHYLLLEHNIRNFLMNDSDKIEDHTYENRPMQRYGMITIFGPVALSLNQLKSEKKLRIDAFELQNKKYPKGITCNAFVEVERGIYSGIFFIQEDVADGQALLEAVSRQLINEIQKIGQDCQCIISDTLYRFFELQECYRKIMQLSLYLYAFPDQSLFFQRELENVKREPVSSESWIEELVRALNEKEIDRARAVITNLFEISRKNLNVWEYSENLKQVYRALKSYVQKNSSSAIALESTDAHGSYLEAEEHVLKSIYEILQTDQVKDMENCSPYVQQAIRFIKANYQQDISVSDIAEAVKISEGHLRRLFKQELNTKVVDYLTEYRLECAKLLMRSSDNVNLVWKKTGFASAQYFSYVFKKKEGMLPREYIKNNKR